MPEPSEIKNNKARIRSAILSQRGFIPAAERQRAAEIIAARPFPIAVSAGLVISGFSPIKSEINPLPLMRALEKAGAQLALPVMRGRGHPLIMRTWAFGDPLKSGQWGIREPLSDAAEVEPDVLIVPLAAFDRAGNRLGYGAGYYDMTIRELRSKKKIVAIGIAFAAQEISRVPASEHDERIDLVLTEREMIDCRRAS